VPVFAGVVELVLGRAEAVVGDEAVTGAEDEYDDIGRVDERQQRVLGGVRACRSRLGQ
jgi:hypothetical protein